MATTTGNQVRQFWQDEAERRLPPETWEIERNRAVTAVYLTLYKANWPLFKWCGMAAFASHRVGLALAPYYFVAHENQIVEVRGGKVRDSHGATVFFDLNLIRETNNRVFRDVAWAHFAYGSPDGGLDAVEKGLSDLVETHRLMLDGFGAIDSGQKLLQQNRLKDAVCFIWRGNALLLQHEQFRTVQPGFQRVRPDFRIFLSLSASMDFSSTLLCFDYWRFSSFDLYMWTVGIWLLVLRQSFPNICDIRQRWFWVSTRVLPMFRRLDLKDASSLFLRLSAMIREAEIAVGPESVDPIQRIALKSTGT
jgi:hypothetical protein